MSTHEVESSTTETADPRAVYRLAFAGFALMLGSGILLWWRFGSAIYFDALAAVQGCF